VGSTTKVAIFLCSGAIGGEITMREVRFSYVNNAPPSVLDAFSVSIRAINICPVHILYSRSLSKAPLIINLVIIFHSLISEVRFKSN
jgi:hypothetical protein